MQSEQVNEIAAALAKAQAAFKPVLKDKVATIPGKDGKPGYSYRYADLASIIAATTAALSESGIAVVQHTEIINAQLHLVAKLIHSSGQWLGSHLPLKLYERPQDMGSALTYARRYTLSGLLGIASEEDDDGSAASKRKGSATLTKEQVGNLWTAAKMKGFDQSKFLELCKRVSGTDVPAKVPAEKYRDLLGEIEKAELPKAAPVAEVAK